MFFGFSRSVDDVAHPLRPAAPRRLKGHALATTTDSYDASSITALEGLEHVRKRPGMYIGSTGVGGLHHLVYEVVDNSVDEAMAGEASRIDITLLADGGCEVIDDGRGIPVDQMKDPKLKGMPAVQAVLSQLNTGGKFDGNGYKVSGGLHGVGVSVVNALSARLECEVDRDGERHFIDFEQRRAAQDQAQGDRQVAPGPAPAPPSASGPTRPSSRRPTSAPRRCSSGSR